MSSIDLKSFVEGLDPKIVEKAKGCATPEELLQLAEDEGIQLPEGLIDSVVGGGDPGAEAVGSGYGKLLSSCF